MCMTNRRRYANSLQILVFFTSMQSIWNGLVVELSVWGLTAGRQGQKHSHFPSMVPYVQLVWLVLVIQVEVGKGEGSASPAWWPSLPLPTPYPTGARWLITNRKKNLIRGLCWALPRWIPSQIIKNGFNF